GLATVAGSTAGCFPTTRRSRFVSDDLRGGTGGVPGPRTLRVPERGDAGAALAADDRGDGGAEPLRPRARPRRQAVVRERPRAARPRAGAAGGANRRFGGAARAHARDDGRLQHRPFRPRPRPGGRGGDDGLGAPGAAGAARREPRAGAGGRGDEAAERGGARDGASAGDAADATPRALARPVDDRPVIARA